LNCQGRNKEQRSEYKKLGINMKSAIIKAIAQSLIACFFFAGLVLPGMHVSAALRSCRTDPILTFSDGTRLVVTATIDTDESSVISVIYTVHAPAGLALVKTVYTAGGLGGDENVIFINDQLPGVYKIDTVVTTRTAGVHVSTNSSLKTVDGSADGVSGDQLVVTLNTLPQVISTPVTPPSTVSNVRTTINLTRTK
jgi:hypothetical protein